MRHFADKHSTIPAVAAYGFDYEGNTRLLTAPHTFAIISYQHDALRTQLARQFLQQQDGVLLADFVNDRQLPYPDCTHQHLYIMPSVDRLDRATRTECQAHHYGLIGLANHTYPNSLRLRDMATLRQEALAVTMQTADTVLLLPSSTSRPEYGVMAAIMENHHAQVLVPQPQVLQRLNTPAYWQQFLAQHPQGVWQHQQQTNLFTKEDDLSL